MRLPGSLGSDNQARRAAREFADLVGRVINATISQAPVTMVEQQGPETTWLVAHCGQGRPAPLPLVNGYHLFLFHVLGRRREGRYLATLEYRYVLQASEDEDSWLVRYEYLREPPPDYRYPRSHVHVNASPEPYRGSTPFPRLHLPAGERVTIEALARHLVEEHGVGPISDHWEAILDKAQAAFEEVQRQRWTT